MNFITTKPATFSAQENGAAFSGRQVWQGLCPAIHEWIRQDQNTILNLLVVRAETLFLL